jgi:hypothetical protein
MALKATAKASSTLEIGSKGAKVWMYIFNTAVSFQVYFK